MLATDIDTAGGHVDLEADKPDLPEVQARSDQTEETGLSGKRPDADQGLEVRATLTMDDHAFAGEAQPREDRDAQRLHLDRSPEALAERTGETGPKRAWQRQRQREEQHPQHHRSGDEGARQTPGELRG